MKLKRARVSMRVNDAGQVEIDIRGHSRDLELDYGSDTFFQDIHETGYCEVTVEVKSVPGVENDSESAPVASDPRD